MAIYASGPSSTKDETHHRRTGSEMAADVDFTSDLFLKMKNKTLLPNTRNKQKCNALLWSETEKEKGIKLGHLPGDSDYDIAIYSCIIVQTMPVVVVGDDTDLLVLLQNHLTPTENETIYP